VTRTATATPPRRLAENALRVANVTLKDAGVEIDTIDRTVDDEYAAESEGIGV